LIPPTILSAPLAYKPAPIQTRESFAERGENLDAVVARQHEIQDHKIERLVVHEEKSFLIRARDTDVVVLGLEPFTKGLRDLLFVLDD
jgi:hypothetical protein